MISGRDDVVFPVEYNKDKFVGRRIKPLNASHSHNINVFKG